jgi:hypothetical protein
MDDWTSAQRYSVIYEPSVDRWIVVDVVLPSEVVGIHPSEDGASLQALAEQDRWRRFAVFPWS